MGNIGWMELVLILIVALVIFGPGKLPEVGKAVGKGISEFKSAISGAGDNKSQTVTQAKARPETDEQEEAAPAKTDETKVNES